jgi:hypothetical protein
MAAIDIQFVDQDDEKDIIVDEVEINVSAIEPVALPDKEEKKVKKSEKKKGPGRPRKVPKKEPAPRRGVSKVPQITANFLEIIYDQPSIFKKIFQFFNSISASEIQIEFQPGRFCLYGFDHFLKSKVRCTFDVSRLNHFYCRDTTDFGINCIEFKKAVDVVDKDSQKIYICSSISNVQKTIQMTVMNDDETRNCFQLNLIELKHRMSKQDMEEFNDTDYTISMNLPVKRFKKIINDVKSISDQMEIRQDSNVSDVYINCQSANKRIEQSIEFNNKQTFKIKSNLGPDDRFHINIAVEYLRQISSSIPAEHIELMFHEKKKIKTKSFLDNNTIMIETLTDIVSSK